MTGLTSEFSVMPVNWVQFENNIAEDVPKLYPTFERSPLALTISQLADADTHNVISRTAASRIWADVWVRDHEVVDQTLPTPLPRRDRDAAKLKQDLARSFSALYPDIYHFLGLSEYLPYLAPNSYSTLTEMQALANLYLYRPSVEEVAELPGPLPRLRALRLIDGFVPLRVASAMLPVISAWQKRGGGGGRELMLRNAVLLEHQGIPLEESARLLKRYSYLKVHEYMARVGVSDEYLDAVDD